MTAGHLLRVAYLPPKFWQRVVIGLFTAWMLIQLALSLATGNYDRAVVVAVIAFVLIPLAGLGAAWKRGELGRSAGPSRPGTSNEA